MKKENLNETNNMLNINVFCTYTSTGLWDAETGRSIEPEEIADDVSPILLLALKLWHEIWEYAILPDVDRGPRMSKMYCERWQEYGKFLVMEMNATQGHYNFVYVEEAF